MELWFVILFSATIASGFFMYFINRKTGGVLMKFFTYYGLWLTLLLLFVELLGLFNWFIQNFS